MRPLQRLLYSVLLFYRTKDKIDVIVRIYDLILGSTVIFAPNLNSVLTSLSFISSSTTVDQFYSYFFSFTLSIEDNMAINLLSIK